MEPLRQCKCTGIRYCSFCKDPVFRAGFKDLYPIDLTQEILTYTMREDRVCLSKEGDILSPESDLDFSGFHVFHDFVSPDEEKLIANSL